jgi:hypothetical protein
MSGYIINPLSSDYNRTSTISNQESIPMLAYGLIGLTSLTLAYLSLIDFKESASGPKKFGFSNPISTNNNTGLFSSKPANTNNFLKTGGNKKTTSKNKTKRKS